MVLRRNSWLLVGVLIVEDDEVIASTMSRGLTLHGYVVDHVPSAEAASAALLSEQFDLAIVDLGFSSASPSYDAAGG